MSNDPRSIPADPIHAATDPVEGEAVFSGRTPRKAEAVRAGVVVGTGLVVALGAAVAMGASPTPTSQAGATAAPSARADGDGSGSRKGDVGFGFGFGGPGGPGGPGDDLGRRGPGDEFGLGGPAGDVGRAGPGKGSGFGKVSVTAISGSSLSLATDDGWTRTITTTSATTITRGGEAATLADISVGDEIRFRQTRNTDGTFTITAVNIVLPSATGTVTAVGTDTITISLRDGTSGTIKTSASTTYRVGKTDGTRADVSVGATIRAVGELAADGSLSARTVAIRVPHVVGRVTATTADTITISRRDGTAITVHVAAGTTIHVAGVGTAKLTDIKAGMLVAAAGPQRADGSIDATDVKAGQPGKGRGHDGADGDDTPDGPAAPDASAGTDG